MTSFWGLNLLNNQEPTEEQLRRWKPSILVSFNPAQAQRLARWAKDWGGKVAYRRFPDNSLNLTPSKAAERARSMVAEVGTDVLVVSQNESPLSYGMVQHEIAFARQALELGSTPVIGAVATGHPTDVIHLPDSSQWVDWLSGAGKMLAEFMNDNPVYFGGHEYADRFTYTYNWPWLVNRDSFLFHFYPGVKHLGLEFGWDSSEGDWKGYSKVTQAHTLELAKLAHAAYRHFPSNALGMAWFAWGLWDIDADFQIEEYLDESTLNQIFAMETDLKPGLTHYQDRWVAIANTSLWERPGANRIRSIANGTSSTFQWNTNPSSIQDWWQYVYDDTSQRNGWVHRSAFSYPFLPTLKSTADPRDAEIAALQAQNALLLKKERDNREFLEDLADSITSYLDN